MLRYTVEKPAFALNVLAAQYRICDDQRTSAGGLDDATKTEILRRQKFYAEKAETLRRGAPAP
jgi:hypothetical protein